VTSGTSGARRRHKTLAPMASEHTRLPHHGPSWGPTTVVDDHPERDGEGQRGVDHGGREALGHAAASPGSGSVTRTVAALGDELAGEEGDALAQAAQLVVARLGARGAGHDLELERAPAPAHDDGRGSAGGGGQRLLEHAVAGDVEAGGDGHRLALDAQADLAARRAFALHERARAREARRRGQREVLVASPQDAEQPAHLEQRVAAGLLDEHDGVLGRREVARRQAARRRRLDDHRAHAVGHDVVQLAGDPDALLDRRALDALLTLDLELARPHGELVVERAAAADHAPGEEGRREHEGQREDDVPRVPRLVERHGDAEQHDGRAGGHAQRAPAPVQGEPEDRDDDRDQRARGVVEAVGRPAGAARQQGGGHEHRGQLRSRAPPQQRRGEQRREEHGAQLVARRAAVREQLRGHRGKGDRREESIARHRVGWAQSGQHGAATLSPRARRHIVPGGYPGSSCRRTRRSSPPAPKIACAADGAAANWRQCALS